VAAGLGYQGCGRDKSFLRWNLAFRGGDVTDRSAEVRQCPVEALEDLGVAVWYEACGKRFGGIGVVAQFFRSELHGKRE